MNSKIKRKDKTQEKSELDKFRQQMLQQFNSNGAILKQCVVQINSKLEQGDYHATYYEFLTIQDVISLSLSTEDSALEFNEELLQCLFCTENYFQLELLLDKAIQRNKLKLSFATKLAPLLIGVQKPHLAIKPLNYVIANTINLEKIDSLLKMKSEVVNLEKNAEDIIKINQQNVSLLKLDFVSISSKMKPQFLTKSSLGELLKADPLQSQIKS